MSNNRQQVMELPPELAAKFLQQSMGAGGMTFSADQLIMAVATALHGRVHAPHHHPEYQGNPESIEQAVDNATVLVARAIAAVKSGHLQKVLDQQVADLKDNGDFIGGD